MLQKTIFVGKTKFLLYKLNFILYFNMNYATVGYVEIFLQYRTVSNVKTY